MEIQSSSYIWLPVAHKHPNTNSSSGNTAPVCMTPQLTLLANKAVVYRQKFTAKTICAHSEPSCLQSQKLQLIVGRHFIASLFILTTEVTQRISFSFSFKALWCEMKPVNTALTFLQYLLELPISEWLLVVGDSGTIRLCDEAFPWRSGEPW